MAVLRDEFLQARLRIEAHGAELEHLKFAAELSDTRLGENDGPAVFEFDEQADDEEHRAEQRKQQEADREVESTFDDGSAVHAAMPAQPFKSEFDPEFRAAPPAPCHSVMPQQVIIDSSSTHGAHRCGERLVPAPAPHKRGKYPKPNWHRP